MEFSGKMKHMIMLKVTKNQGFNLSLRDKLFKIKFNGTTCNSNQKLSK